MAELTPDQRLFWKTEQQKKAYMKQGYTKKQALEKIRDNLVAVMPENYVVGIEKDHITIRQMQSTDIAETLRNMFGSDDKSKEFLEKIKKSSAGFAEAASNVAQNDSDVKSEVVDDMEEE